MNLPKPHSRSPEALIRILSGASACDADDEPPVIPEAMDIPRIEAAVREILFAIGENPDREGLVETPARVARMYAEVFSGLHTDPTELLRKTFTQHHDEMVLVKARSHRPRRCSRSRSGFSPPMPGLRGSGFRDCLTGQTRPT